MLFQGEKAVTIALGFDSVFTPVYITGRNSDVDTGSEDIVDAGGLYTPMSTAAAVHCSRSAVADTTQTLTLTGLDAAGAPQVETKLLEGRTEVVVPGTWSAINSCSLSAACAGDVYVYIDDTVTNGVPDTSTKVRAKILIADTVTHMAVYTVPAGYDLLLTEYTSNQADVQLWTIASIGGALQYAESLQGRRLMPRAFPAGTFLKLRCTATADNQDVRATLAGLLRKA